MSGIIAGQEAAAARATSEDTVTALREAIGVISSVCDYAQSDDARGFNAADAWLGHVLAQMPAALWTDDAALAAWDMLCKYRGQLAAAGIGYDDLPRPAGADELEAGRREQARQRARDHAQRWREQHYRQAHAYLRCDGDGGQVTFAFPYDPALVAACRAIPGRRYDGAAKANVFSFTSLPTVIKLADAHQIEVTVEVRALAKITAERAGLHASPPPVRLDDRKPETLPSAAGDGDDDQAQADIDVNGRRLREFAHRYLEDGLWPVPAWGARPGGECCCSRGPDCARPGKHPRSVHTGPGPRDYSWKPLACRSHAEVDQRFGPGSRYGAGNLMVAIPPGMMAIDRDDDDGGRAAIAELAGELGELPPTLAHRTPHGEHLVYRTPPGWKGRAWVGKDPANPVPAGVDLRMPGQVLMAAPSVVPGREGPVRYGPVRPDRIAALPAAYLTAWTPPQPAPRPPSQPVPVPPNGADRAARYVHDALTDIAAELASRPPGGRNAAAYTAGLKAGSLLGAARATPGAEQASAGWTDEATEQALMDAAQRNGYVDKDGEPEARRAIRSGFRNGLRRPRTLPDFAAIRTTPAAQPRQRTAAPQAQPPQSQAPTVGTPRAGPAREPAPPGIHHGIEAADQAASIASRDEQQDEGTTAPPDGSTRIRANRIAAAANQAYRAGDLDAARQLTEQAAVLDSNRADLWQQHQEQIAARRLILDAQAAHADSDHQRVQELLGQARHLDPRMPAIWDGDLPALPSARTAHDPREHAAGPEPHGPVGSSPAIQGIDTRQQARAAATPADPEAPQPSWPESTSRGEPGIPAPRTAVETGRMQPPSRRDAAAAPPEPQARAGITTGDIQPGAEALDDDPSPRWPAPDPHAARPGISAQADHGPSQSSWPSSPARRQPQQQESSPAADSGSSWTPPSGAAPAGPRLSPGTATHRADADVQAAATDPARWPTPEEQARPERGTGQPSSENQRQPGTTSGAEPVCGRNPRRPAASDPDWRDHILDQARQPAQPGPSWPHSPALRHTPELGMSDAGLEPGR